MLVVSPGILSEYRRVGRELAKGRPALDAALDALLALIAVHATVVDAPPLDVPVSADPAYRKSALASSFVAALELARQGRLEIEQDEAFDELFVRKVA